MNTKKFFVYALLDCFMLVSMSNGYREVVGTFASVSGVNRYVKGTGIKYRYEDRCLTSRMDMECELEKLNYEI